MGGRERFSWIFTSLQHANYGCSTTGPHILWPSNSEGDPGIHRSSDAVICSDAGGQRAGDKRAQKQKISYRTCCSFSHSGWNAKFEGSTPPRSAFFASLFFLLASVLLFCSSFAFFLGGPCFLMSLSGNDRLGLLDPSGLKRNLEPGLVDANDDLLLQLQGLPFPGMVEL